MPSLPCSPGRGGAHPGGPREYPVRYLTIVAKPGERRERSRTYIETNYAEYVLKSGSAGRTGLESLQVRPVMPYR